MPGYHYFVSKGITYENRGMKPLMRRKKKGGYSSWGRIARVYKEQGYRGMRYGVQGYEIWGTGV